VKGRITSTVDECYDRGWRTASILPDAAWLRARQRTGRALRASPTAQLSASTARHCPSMRLKGAWAWSQRICIGKAKSVASVRPSTATMHGISNRSWQNPSPWNVTLRRCGPWSSRMSAIWSPLSSDTTWTCSADTGRTAITPAFKCRTRALSCSRRWKCRSEYQSSSSSGTWRGTPFHRPPPFPQCEGFATRRHRTFRYEGGGVIVSRNGKCAWKTPGVLRVRRHRPPKRRGAGFSPAFAPGASIVLARKESP